MITFRRKTVGKLTEKLPLKTKLIFGSGDIFGGASVNMVSLYYLIFLTDVVQIPPSLAGTVILISKIWDAFSDPLMGVLTDRTRTRLGKRRPYFIAAAFTIFLASLLLWNPVAFESLAVRFVYVLLSYLFFNTVSTMVLIPYIARQPSLTHDYDERTSLNLIKALFSFSGTIVGTVLPLTMLRFAADIRYGYRLTAVIMGLLFALPWIVISIHLKEPDNRTEPPPPPFRISDFIRPLQIRTFRFMVGIYLCSLLSMDLLTVMIAYFVSTVRTAPVPNMVIFSGIISLGGLVFFPASLAIARRFGKGRAFIVSAVLFLSGLTMIALWGDQTGSWASGFIGLVAVLGILGLTIFPWTMFPDAADVGRLAWGYSSAGSFGGIMTLFRKLSSAFALFLVGLALGAAGYINPEQIQTGANLTLQRIPQPPQVILMIRILLPLLPFLLLSLGIFLAWNYPLKQRVYEKMERYLQFRDEGIPGGELSPEDLAELRKRLI